jgi:hypothetical protein
LHAAITPGKYSWIGAGSGKSGITYNYVVWQDESAVELYIDRGKDADTENKAIFDTLYLKKDQIEKEFGGELEWQRLDNKRACRIRKSFELGGWKDPNTWDAVVPPMVDAMTRLEKALKPHIQKLAIEAS